MYENLKEEFDEKVLALAEYLGLEEDEVQNIEEESDVVYSYGGLDYYVLDQVEADDKLEEYVQDMIYEVENLLNKRLIEYSYYLKVDEDAIRENYDYDEISENWKEVGDYYVFEI